ncbi:heparinase II/III family protein [Rhodoligotrophos defluvii]|uniref:heparinase II/III family protein n=1 Tax=Rhodoligotrophos defluvii TaxID=2561934 RepID=UPI0010C98095|nr:heparinase II/III family protein [Rhodoligotrophos defluvii]
MAAAGSVAGSPAAELMDALARRTAHRLIDRAAGLVPRLAFRAASLSHPPRPLLRGDPDFAAAIYRGRFALAGHTVEAGSRSIFALLELPANFAAELHGFSWLKHLEAADTELARIQGRAHISDWITTRCYKSTVARDLSVAARRLISWLLHGPFLLHNADPAFARLFLGSLNRQASHLARALHLAPTNRGRLDAAIALGYAAISLGGLEKLRTELLDRLGQELEEQVLPDGGHISRNPAATVELLLDLLPLREAVHARKLHAPPPLDAAVERMLPFLRFLLHGDGGIATFNGVTDHMAGAVRALIDADDVRGKPITLARHTGYARLAFGRSTVLVDVGRPPAVGLNPAMQSGPLAFEFSDGPHRIVVNCGTSKTGNAAWAAASRRTAAHSTVCMGDRSASLIIDNGLTARIFGGPVLLGPQTVYGELTAHETGSVLEAYHNGYLAQFGYLHERRLFLAKHGADLRGEDRFLAAPDGRVMAPDTPFTVRFHIHPAVKVMTARDGTSVSLLLPNRVGWKFSARGAAMRVENSVYLPGLAAPRRAQQIVLSGRVGASRTVRWAFKRIDKPATASHQGSAPELPL